MTALIYACAVVAVCFWGWFSDHYNRRGIPLMISAVIMGVGYVILLSATGVSARYAGAVIVAVGGFPVILLILMWAVVNVVGFTKR